MDALKELVEKTPRFIPFVEHRLSDVCSADISPVDELIIAPEFSDVALAAQFVAGSLPTLRWTPGIGWMVFDGTVWARDDRKQRFTAARRVCCENASQTDDDAEAKRLASAKTINAVVTVAEADQRLVVPADVWDQDQMILNSPAGVVDLATAEVRDRGEEYLTLAARVTPDFAMPCPTWERFLAGVFMGDAELVEFMRRSLGYMLTGDRSEQVLWFWYGLGANGKSVLAELVQWIAGSYSLKLPASVLMQARGERHPTELAQLRGKRLAISSELDENSYFNESLIKELTGDNTLTARFMRGDFFEFAMTQKHVIIGNFKPRLRGGDQAMARRMLLVPFNASFKGAERDPAMLDKLKQEAPGILAWIVRGAADWSRDGLAVPAIVRDASAEYMSEHDDTMLWIDECCVRTGEAKAGDLYKSFRNWKKDRGEHAPSLTSWGARLATLPGLTKRRSSVVRYTGISLNESEQRRVYASGF